MSMQASCLLSTCNSTRIILNLYNSANSLNHANFLVWSGIRTAVPAHLKDLDVTESELESCL